MSRNVAVTFTAEQARAIADSMDYVLAGEGPGDGNPFENNTEMQTAHRAHTRLLTAMRVNGVTR